ncbi:hypothetical protein BDY21DRAFT_38957 [Lineolata rhizophorae]|uniref:Uncharacterized protein n=1 Tax=Lineolata rhizophorae TaxID=578093 RepID=A0A6A6P043_9PEZI|nr:hypothetical protein BDY21DRAFT_38957 [Lineolata rhizophorae]
METGTSALRRISCAWSWSKHFAVLITVPFWKFSLGRTPWCYYTFDGVSTRCTHGIDAAVPASWTGRRIDPALARLHASDLPRIDLDSSKKDGDERGEASHRGHPLAVAAFPEARPMP